MKFVLGTKKAYDQNFLLTKANRIKILFFLEGKSLVSNYSKKTGNQKNGPSPEETIDSPRMRIKSCHELPPENLLFARWCR